MERGQLVPGRHHDPRCCLDRLEPPRRRRRRHPRRLPAEPGPGRGARRRARRARRARRSRAVDIDVPAEELVRRLSGRLGLPRIGPRLQRAHRTRRASPGRCDLDGSPLDPARRRPSRDASGPGWPCSCRACATSSTTTGRAASCATVDGRQPIDAVTRRDLLDGLRRRRRRGGLTWSPASRAPRSSGCAAPAASSPRSSPWSRPSSSPASRPADLDAIAEAHIRAAGATPSFKGYPGINPRRPFPASVCISIDDEIVHGIPGEPDDPRRPDRVGRRRRDRRRLAR